MIFLNSGDFFIPNLGLPPTPPRLSQNFGLLLGKKQIFTYRFPVLFGVHPWDPSWLGGFKKVWFLSLGALSNHDTGLLLAKVTTPFTVRFVQRGISRTRKKNKARPK